MGIFEDVVNSAKSAADYVGNKTGEFVEVTKVRSTLADAESKLNREYQSLGRFAYDSFKNGTDLTEIATEKAAAIDEITAQIKELTEKLADLKGQKKCEVCGAINAEEANFCTKCGASLNKTEQ